MTRKLLLGIDVGTTALKVVVADTDGALLAQCGEEYPTSYPQPNRAEQDPEQWWRACCSVIPRALALAGAAGDAVAGIGVTGQGIGVVAVDAHGQPLRPAIIWLDRRSDAQCARLRETVGEATVTSINGARIDSFFLAPKWLWVKEREPEICRRTADVLQSNGYLIQRLTGARRFAVSDGPMTLFFDAARREYHAGLADAMGIDLAQMPRVAQCSEVVGTVTREAAAATGLAVGTPVVAGSVDGVAAAIEGGVLDDGDAAEMTGQSSAIMICASKPYFGRDLLSHIHPTPGKYMAVGASTAAGGSLKWWRDQLADAERARAFTEGRDAFQALDELAAGSPPGANRLVFLPYLFGERSPIWDTDARGVFFGLSMATTKGDMVRAIMEGVAFGMRQNIDAAAADGFTVRTLHCSGGGARSDLWNQIKADTLGLPVRLPAAACGAAMGGAMMAGVGVGAYRDFADAKAAVVRIKREYLPNEANRRVYDDLYGVFRELYPALKASYARLARAGAQ